MWSDHSFTVPPCPLNTANKYSWPKTKAFASLQYVLLSYTDGTKPPSAYSRRERYGVITPTWHVLFGGDKICSIDRMPRQVYRVSEIPFHLSLLLFLLYHLDFTVFPLGVTVADRAGVLKSSHACQRSQIVTDSAVSYYSVISECVCVCVCVYTHILSEGFQGFPSSDSLAGRAMSEGPVPKRAG